MTDDSQDRLRVEIFGRNGARVAEILQAPRGDSSTVSFVEGVSTEAHSEITKYANLIKACLDMGEGTYTGTITPE